MTSRPAKKKACSGPPAAKNRPYDSRPTRSGADPAMRRTSPNSKAVRVVMPDEPPRLNPEAARVLLRILLKAHARLADTKNPQGGGAE
jgi:hypothetical protein